MRGFSLLQHKRVNDRNKASIAHDECCHAPRKLINQQVSMMKSNSRVAKMALPLAYTAINRNERQFKLSQSVGSRHPVAKTFNVIRNTASLLAAAGIMTALATAGMAQQQQVPTVSPKQFGPRVNAPKTGAPNRPGTGPDR